MRGTLEEVQTKDFLHAKQKIHFKRVIVFLKYLQKKLKKTLNENSKEDI